MSMVAGEPAPLASSAELHRARRRVTRARCPRLDQPATQGDGLPIRGVSALERAMVNPLPTWETARLLLVPISLDDAAGYAEHFVDYEVIRYLSADVPVAVPTRRR